MEPETRAPGMEDLASGGDESDTRHSSNSTRNSALPTHSKVHERLSDASALSSSSVSSSNASNKYDDGADHPAADNDSTNASETTISDDDRTIAGDSMASRSRASTHLSVDRRASTASSTLSLAEDATRSTRSRSTSSVSSTNSVQVDWEELEKSEEQAPRNEGSDESTAFLLARLEQENNALASNPKATINRMRSRKGTKTRPPSIQHLKKLVNEPPRPSLRYSQVPEPPPMTELEFWAALVKDYPQTAQRLPTLTSNKIRSGIPPPLRGVVWMSIAGSRDVSLEEQYDRLCGETSPYEHLIGKDIGRSFPGVEMFRDPSGDGQQMLGRVLKCFSLYDHEIGYCQGLGFVVGPMLMHMGEKEAFCALVRLMEHYDLRSCFLPDLSGLHIRIYQFQRLLAKHHPKLSAHLDTLQVEPSYVSQWFLSFFAVTCPLPMLLRIYDVILTEGASETLMRVALSLMRRNEKKILACTELEDAVGLLLSRALWDTYNCDADDLVNDFVGLTGLVTREGLEAMEATFKNVGSEDTVATKSATQNIQATASRLLGQFWAGSTASASPKVTSPTSSLNVAPVSRPVSYLQRSPSKQSVASTMNSIESLDSHLTAATEATGASKNATGDNASIKSGKASKVGASTQDRDLHVQIEDLLTALSDMQREQALLASELQREREEREEDRGAVQRFLESLKKPSPPLEAIPEGEAHNVSPNLPPTRETHDQATLSELEDHFTPATSKRSSLMHQTKHQMREDIKLWKEQHDVELTRSADLSRQLTETKTENDLFVQEMQAIRNRLDATQQEKERLEQALSEYKNRRYSTESDFEPVTPIDSPMSAVSSAGGGNKETPTQPQQVRMARQPSIRSLTTPTSAAGSVGSANNVVPFSKRSTSLGISSVLATEDHKPPSEDALLLELVAVKTSEAVARQELEEVKAKLDSLRKILGGGPSPSSLQTISLSSTSSNNNLSSPNTTSSSRTLRSPSNGTSGGHRPSASDAGPILRAPSFNILGRSSGGATSTTTPTSTSASTKPSNTTAQSPPESTAKSPAATTSSGGGVSGFFSGWGKRSVSNNTPPPPPSAPAVAGSAHKPAASVASIASVALEGN